MAITDLSSQLSAAIINAGIPTDLIVTRQESSGPIFDPVIVDIDQPAVGWIDEFDLSLVANSIVSTTDVRVIVLQSSLDVAPIATNKITVDGATFTILSVSADPAGTTWDMRCQR